MKRSSTWLQSAKPLSQFQLTSITILSKRCILFIILVLMATAGFAQAPNISYHTLNVFETDTTITPLAPTNTGGVVPNPATVQVVANAQIPKNDNSTTYYASFTVDATGNIYYCNHVGHNILKFPVGGGPAIPLGSGIEYPTDVAVDAAGNVYVTENFLGTTSGQPKVLEIPVGGGPMVIVGTGLSVPNGLAVDAAGNIYVADTNHNAIVKFSPGNTTPVIVASAPNLHPYGIALDASGNIYFVNGINLYKIPVGSGHASLFTRRPVTSAKSIAMDAAGNIYLAEGEQNQVLNAGPSEAYLITKIPADGSGDVREGTAPLSFYCTVVAVTPSGSIFTNDVSAVGVYQITQGNYSISSSLPQGLFLNANSGNISGTPIYGSPATNYTITAHNNAGNSSATVNIKVISTNARLSQLVLGNGEGVGTQALSFGGTIPFDVSYGITSTTLKPTVQDSNATIKINGATVRSGSASAPFSLALGQNNFTIVVTAPDRITTKTYNVQILRHQSSNNYLVHLTVSKGILSPVFSRLTNSYSVLVSSAIASITVTPTMRDTTARQTVNGAALASGATSAAIPLSIGPNTITIAVTAQDGTINRYTITVTRAPSPDTFLATLGISRGIFSPKFSHLITSYTVGVGPSVTSVTLTPTALNPNATITVNGIAVSSGAASQSIPLVTYYENLVSIVITSPDGLKRTYSVFVERASSPDTTLSNLTISQGTLSPAFAKTTTAYTAMVDNSVTSITVTPTANDSTATLQVQGVSVASGTPSAPISLAVGDNTIGVLVTAQNRTEKQTYTVIVTRAAGGANTFYEPVSIARPLEITQFTEDGINVHAGITPNGDGINDFLRIDGISAYPDNKLQIMNANGTLVFEAINYDNSSKVFDGHSSKTGVKQMPGTYFYSLDYTVKGVAKHKTGFIVLKY